MNYLRPKIFFAISGIFLLFLLFCNTSFVLAVGETCTSNSDCAADEECIDKICPVIACPGEKACSIVTSPESLKPNLGELCNAQIGCQTGSCILVSGEYRCGINSLPYEEAESPFPSEFPQPGLDEDCSNIACQDPYVCNPQTKKCVSYVSNTTTDTQTGNNTVAPDSQSSNSNTEIYFTPTVGIGDEFQAGQKVKIEPDTLAKFIRSTYKYMIGIVGIIAAIVMMFGGIKWLTAGGDSGKVSDAQEWIKASLTGLVLALSAFLILSTVNTDLVNLKSLEIKQIDPTSLNVTEIEDEVASARATGGCCVGPSAEKSQTITCGWVEADTKCDYWKSFKQGQSCFNLSECPDADKECEASNEKNPRCPEESPYCIGGKCSAGLNTKNLSDCTKETGGRVTGDLCFINNKTGYCEDEKCKLINKPGEPCEEDYQCSNKNCYFYKPGITECYDGDSTGCCVKSILNVSFNCSDNVSKYNCADDFYKDKNCATIEECQ